MDGSSLSLIVIPIVVAISLAVWVAMVLYADSHPQWGRHSPVPGHQSSGPAEMTDQRPPVARPTVPAGMAGTGAGQRVRTGARSRADGPRPLRTPAGSRHTTSAGHAVSDHGGSQRRVSAPATRPRCPAQS